MVGSGLQDFVQLSIETTGRTGSIAVLRGEAVLERTNLDPNQRTASTLAPQLDRMLRHCRDQGLPISLVSVADGPGSFTGLRIGVTTAKTLCYALGLPLVAVDSLAAIAAAGFHADQQVESICVAIDAYRGQVFSGTFHRMELLPSLDRIAADWTAHPTNVEVLGGDQWQQRLSQLPTNTGLAGDKKPFASRPETRIERPCDAVGVGLLAIRAFQIGAQIEPFELLPRYLRVSAAEEKLEGSKCDF